MFDSKVKEKRWRTARAMGYVTSPQPADEFHTTIRRLFDLGFSTPAMATSIGVTPTTIKQILHGQSTVLLSTIPKLRLLSIPHVFAHATDRAHVPSYAAVRRIRALQAMGWDHASIDEFLPAGLWSHNVKPRARLEAQKHRDIAAVYKELHMRVGPSPGARRFALSRDYMPPLAWNDLDDPLDRPERHSEAPGDDSDRPLCEMVVDEVAVMLAMDGKPVPLTLAERHHAIIRAHNAGLSARGDIPQRLGITERTVNRHLLDHRTHCLMS